VPGCLWLIVTWLVEALKGVWATPNHTQVIEKNLAHCPSDSEDLRAPSEVLDLDGEDGVIT